MKYNQFMALLVKTVKINDELMNHRSGGVSYFQSAPLSKLIFMTLQSFWVKKHWVSFP